MGKVADQHDRLIRRLQMGAPDRGIVLGQQAGNRGHALEWRKKLGKDLGGLLGSQDPRMINRRNFNVALPCLARDVENRLAAGGRERPLRVLRCRNRIAVSNQIEIHFLRAAVSLSRFGCNLVS